jgi:ATP-binding cassette subfamily B protein IrtA
VTDTPSEPAGPPSASRSRHLLRSVRHRLALAVALQALGALLGVVPFIAVAWLASRLTSGAKVTGGQVWPLVGLACASGIAALMFGFAAGAVSHLADNVLQLRLRRELARHISRMPLGQVTGAGSGQLTTAVQDDVRALHSLLAHALLDVTALLSAPLLALAYLITVDWRLGLLSLLPLVLGVYFFGRAMAGAKTQMAEYGQAQARISSAAVEFATGIAVVKAFGRGRSAHARFLAATDAFSDFFTRWVGSTVVTSAMALLVVSPVLVLLLLVVAGVVLTVAGALPAVGLVAFVLLSPAVSAPMGIVGTRIQQIRAGQAAATRIAALLEDPVLPDPTEPAVPADATVRMRGVSFSYDGRTDALAGIDLDLTPGTVTALVGPSGSGKSTLAGLLARFHDVTRGSITIGGADVRQIPAEQLYRHVGFVLQDVRLLRDSIAGNLRLGRHDATDEQLVTAAKAAQIHDRIAALPNGYHTRVGTEVSFSGGEAQRLSIARTLLADTPIVILDEATAFADPQSEALIQDALSALAAGRTLLVIAHRLASIASADRIVVLEAGQIAEAGRHTDLLAANGRYARMWRAQEIHLDHPATTTVPPETLDEHRGAGQPGAERTLQR